MRIASAFRGRFGREGGSGNVRGRIGDAGVKEGFSSFDTGSASTAVKNATLVARPGAGVVDFQFNSSADNGGFIHRDERAQKFNFCVGSFFHGLGHRGEEVFSAVGVDGVITSVSGNGNGIGAKTFGVACAEGKKDSISKRDNGFLHRLFFVVTVGNYSA